MQNQEPELIDQAVNGDKKALETLLLSVQDMLYNLSLRMPVSYTHLDLQRGHPHRGGDSEGHGTAHGGEDQFRHCPPALHHPERRPHSGGPGWRHRGTWQPHGAACQERLLCGFV